MLVVIILVKSLSVQSRQAGGAQGGEPSCEEFAYEPSHPADACLFGEEPQKTARRPARRLPAATVHMVG